MVMIKNMLWYVMLQEHGKCGLSGSTHVTLKVMIFSRLLFISSVIKNYMKICKKNNWISGCGNFYLISLICILWCWAKKLNIQFPFYFYFIFAAQQFVPRLHLKTIKFVLIVTRIHSFGKRKYIFLAIFVDHFKRDTRQKKEE